MGQERGLLGQPRRITGPGAAAIKYDILTALLVTATRGDAVEGRLALRLSLLITARFNWRQGTFSVGLKEMARMWGVTDRTAKREIAAMRGLGWIAISVPAARGRVAQYRIDFPTILRSTVPHWQAVGPDFAARMSDSPDPTGTDKTGYDKTGHNNTGNTATNVVPLRPDPDMPDDDGSPWASAAAKLRQDDPTVYAAWMSGLRVADVESGILTLTAPSRFVADYVETHFRTRLIAVILTCDSGIRDVRIVGPIVGS